jgi:hypothetical protein
LDFVAHLTRAAQIHPSTSLRWETHTTLADRSGEDPCETINENHHNEVLVKPKLNATTLFIFGAYRLFGMLSRRELKKLAS